MSVSDLRLATASEFRSNSGDYLPFLTHPETGNMLTEPQFKKYCLDIECTSAWGGQVEIRALANVLKIPVEVIQAEGPPIVVGEEFKSQERLVVTYHRHMYGLGEHYNATKKIEES